MRALTTDEAALLRKLYQGRRFGGAHLLEANLLHGVPRDRLPALRVALRTLKREGILRAKATAHGPARSSARSECKSTKILGPAPHIARPVRRRDLTVGSACARALECTGQLAFEPLRKDDKRHSPCRGGECHGGWTLEGRRACLDGDR